MQDYTPPETILLISKLKFLRALVPLAIIIVALILQNYYDLDNARYLSLLALGYFLFIMLIYRINKTIDETDRDSLLSPIYGKVVSLEDEKAYSLITIKKSFLHPADIRLSQDNDTIESSNHSSEKNRKVQELSSDNRYSLNRWQLTGKNVHYFPATNRIKGTLIGIIPGNGLCRYRLPKNFSLHVDLGDKLSAGISIIGVKR